MSTHIKISNQEFFQKYKLLHAQLDQEHQKQLWQHLINRFLSASEHDASIIDRTDPFGDDRFSLNEAESNAVTPEIFGIIFENMMENRSAKAAFYTPRTIATLMCRYSLIYYLSQKTPFSKEDLSAFLCRDDLPPAILRDTRTLDTALLSFRMLDPAVGAGAFLLAMFYELLKARQKVSTLSPRALKLDIIKNSLFAVDTDADAISITKLRLWLADSVPPESTFDCFEPSIFCQDFLMGDDSDFFQKNDRFDLVIGNPPYLDSETMTRNGMSELRHNIAKRYHFAKGNWDLYIPFFEKGFSILSDCGSLCYITPDKWLSKPFGQTLRTTLFPYLHTLISAGHGIFDTVRVDAMISRISQTKTEKISVFKMERERIRSLGSFEKSKLPLPFSPDLLFSDAIQLIQKLEHENQTLGDFYTCENACSTADCYRLKEILFSLSSLDAFDPAQHFKVINTGTIGSFDSKWGLRPMKYLGDTYLYPVVDKNVFFQRFPNSYARKSKKSKLMIKGLTSPIATIDEHADCIPGKTTLMIAVENKRELAFLAALLNSTFARFFLRQKYAFSSYNGGITLTKAMIHSLPFRRFTNTEMDAVLSTVNTLRQNHSSDFSTLDRQIYALFSLTPQDLSPFNLH